MTTSNERPSDVGIVAIEFYFPAQYVSQTELESFDGASAGKYTVGLGQLSMAFVNDREDVRSICLTAVHNLLEKYNIAPSAIGRVEVGTETILDKSKSIKSELMRLFAVAGNTSVEGVDSINACYGGTAALFNSISWVESSAWDGRYALCVAGDIAVYGEGNARPTGGCGAVAMLIGPNAPLAMESRLRCSHMEPAYDFYKPNLASEYPVVDGKMSISCYLRAVDHCYRAFRVKAENSGDMTGTSLDSIKFACFHSPFNKLVQKSVGRILYNDFLAHKDAPEWDDVPESLRNIPDEESYTHRELELFFAKRAQEAYASKVVPSVLLSQQLGNSYTASLYSGLVSLLSNVDGELLRGQRVMMFSYGSGLCSSMFSFKVGRSDEAVAQLREMSKKLDVHGRLARRVKVSPEDFSGVLKKKESMYGAKNVEPSSSIEGLFPGTYYLTSIDDMWRRHYQRKL
jgi:hydroxymethylglutaryl-CoA synthase